MFQNMKVDIVYYKTNTDFEMEFNLCGCCRMRLLNSKANDKKNLILSLSRAVSRSRIIILVGSLFGEDNIIENTASAIGKQLSTADNATYGINSSEEISIIDGSVPLVSKDGYFGGCIIESGPQTMVLISDSKNIRKSIMNTLIHPYIQDLFAGELKEKNNSEEPLKEEIAEEITSEEIADETIEEVSEEQAEEAADVGEIAEEQATELAETAALEDTDIVKNEIDDIPETEEKEKNTAEENEPDTVKETTVAETSGDDTKIAEDDIALEGNMVFETDEGRFSAPKANNQETIDLYSEAKKIRRKDAKFYNEAYGDFELKDVGLIVDDDENEFGQSYYGFSNVTRIAIFVISIMILAAVAVLCYFLIYLPLSNGNSPIEYIKEIFGTLFG